MVIGCGRRLMSVERQEKKRVKKAREKVFFLDAVSMAQTGEVWMNVDVDVDEESMRRAEERGKEERGRKARVGVGKAKQEKADGLERKKEGMRSSKDANAYEMHASSSLQPTSVRARRVHTNGSPEQRAFD